MQIVTPKVIICSIFLLFNLLATNVIANVVEECNDDEDAFSIYCPSTEWLGCNDEIWDLSWLPNAYYHDYTGTHDAGYPTIKYHLNDCNIGYILRTWKVADYNGVWHKCTQKIYVQGNYFNSSSITWPGNVDLVGCNVETDPQDLPYGKQMPSWSTYGATCSKIGYNYHDNVYTYGPGCYEIIRTWSIVDCCNFNPMSNIGIWSYNQRISVTSTGEEPQVWVPYDVSALTHGCKKVQVDIPPLEVKDGCDDQYIITNNSPYATYSGADASGKYPVGTTKVRFMVKYNCWKTKFYYVNVTVSDESTPVPYCYYGLSFSLMGVDTDDDGLVDDGMRELWASDLDAGSYHPCNNYADLTFSFSSDPTDKVRVFTCEDVGEKELEIWVTDSYGKQDYCGTYVDIQNNAANIPNCDPLEYAEISGKITSVFGNTEDLIMHVNSSFEGMEFDTAYSVQEVFAVIDSSVNNNGTVSYDYGIEEVSIPDVDTTHIDKDYDLEVSEGDYFLTDLDLNEDYLLTIDNMSDVTLDIDSMDVKVLKNYLDGGITLNDFQKMAADVNNDKMVDALDYDLLKAFVEGTLTNEIDLSWVTFDPTYEMQDPVIVDVDDYPTSKMVEIKNRNAVNADIIIFQMGDLTHDLEIGSINNTLVQQRDISAFHLESIAPNPFSDLTQFEIVNDREQLVQLEIYDLKGSKMFNRAQILGKGQHTLSVQGEEMKSTGIYFYILRTESETLQGKIIKIK